MVSFARLFAFVVCPLALWAQHAQTGDPNSEGQALYRSNCAFCHGIDGRGGRGSNLTGQLNHGDAPDTIKKIIKNGLPGTQMPSFGGIEEDELDRLVTFVRAFSRGSGGNEKVAGDPAQGRRLYESMGCPNCHRIGSQGSIYGPELTRIGVARSLSYLRDSIVNPSADIPEEYQGVTAVTKEGRRLTGVRLNEDSFTVQLRQMNSAYRSFEKAELQGVTHEKNSLMPAYNKMTPDDLNHLLAYLVALRGEAPKTGIVDKAKGIQ